MLQAGEEEKGPASDSGCPGRADGSTAASQPGSGGVKPRKGKGAPNSALPTSKHRENTNFLLFCLPRLPTALESVGPNVNKDGRVF